LFTGNTSASGFSKYSLLKYAFRKKLNVTVFTVIFHFDLIFIFQTASLSFWHGLKIILLWAGTSANTAFLAAVPLIKNEPNPLNSTFSPRERASLKVSMTLSMQADASRWESPVVLLAARIKEALLIIMSPHLDIQQIRSLCRFCLYR
jgi:hypothetical protein